MSSDVCRRLVSDGESLVAVRRLFEFIDHRDREIFHRNVTLALGIAEQLITAEPKASRALIGSEVCGRGQEGPVEIAFRLESFEKPSTGRCFGLECLWKSVRITVRRPSRYQI